MLKSTKDINFPFFFPEYSASENYYKSPIKIQDYGVNTTVVLLLYILKYRVKDNENKHKVWFIMDSNLILPEYLV